MARSAGRTRPVIKDVAKLAGVSAPTVSRYLNGTVNVTEDKRERIAKAIKELGYEPSIVARALSNREMDSVVVFAANPSAFSTSETNHGVEAAARKRRFLLNIVSLDESDMDSVKARVRMGLSIRPAGVIVYEYDRAGIAALEYIPKDMPMVVVGGSFGDGEYQVINAERDGGRWMTMHLLDLGHRTVFHVGRPEGPTDNTRTNGWRDALKERGVTAPDPIIVPDDDLEESVKAGRTLGRRGDVTAIFAGSWTPEGNQMARRDNADPSGLGNTLGWAWAWPLNRRILYNRASADPQGNPWDPKRQLLKWDGTKWTGWDIPDYSAAPPGSGVGPFIMQQEGMGRLFALDKMAWRYRRPKHVAPKSSRRRALKIEVDERIDMIELFSWNTKRNQIVGNDPNCR